MSKSRPDPVYAWESVSGFLRDGMEDLLTAHWDTIPLAVDWEQYRWLERHGILRAISMRQAGQLIGYNVFFVRPTLHYSTSLWAVNDVIYLDPDHRKGMAGVRLIRAAEPMLRGIGVQQVLYHTKMHVHLGHGKARGTLGRLLTAMGYNLAEEVYSKIL
jgi:GNAT superfamily N-acetyltransferase